MNNISCSQYLQNYFTFTNETHSKNVRSAEKFSLYIPEPKVEIFCETFAYFGAAIRNSSPLIWKNASSIETFKSRYLIIVSSLNIH